MKNKKIFKGIVIKSIKSHKDKRGFFIEIFKLSDKYTNKKFKQISHSKIKKGVLKEAISEERFTRIKNFRGLPLKSIKYIFNKYKINFKDIDYILTGIIDSIRPNHQIKNKFEKKLNSILTGNKSVKFKKKFYERINSEIKWNKKYLGEIVKYSKKKKFFKKLFFIDHHKSHAASAYFCSPFNNANIFTFDGKGGFKSSTFFEAENEKFVEKDFNTTFESLGYFYGNITKALGFKAERHEGKITGLAAYGKKTSIIKYFKSFIKFKDGRINITLGEDYMPWFCSEKHLPKFYKKIAQYSKADVAFGAQYILENIILRYIKSKIRRKKNVNVCLAGGVFANVKLNQKIMELNNVKNVFIQPAMSDSGLSIGSIYAFLNEKFSIKPKYLNDVYLGSGLKSNLEIEKKFRSKGLNYYLSKNIEDELIREFKNKRIVGFLMVEWNLVQEHSVIAVFYITAKINL